MACLNRNRRPKPGEFLSQRHPGFQRLRFCHRTSVLPYDRRQQGARVLIQKHMRVDLARQADRCNPARQSIGRQPRDACFNQSGPVAGVLLCQVRARTQRRIGSGETVMQDTVQSDHCKLDGSGADSNAQNQVTRRRQPSLVSSEITVAPWSRQVLRPPSSDGRLVRSHRLGKHCAFDRVRKSLFPCLWAATIPCQPTVQTRPQPHESTLDHPAPVSSPAVIKGYLTSVKGLPDAVAPRGPKRWSLNTDGYLARMPGPSPGHGPVTRYRTEPQDQSCKVR